MNDSFEVVSRIFSRYCLIILFVLGSIGLTLNTLIFTRKTFRSNSCVHYFLASTVANYFVVFFILPSRILSDGFQIDPGRYDLFYCKFRFYTYFTAKSLSSWFIVLACYDRKMSSSRDVHQRDFARLKISRRMICATTILGLLFYAHVLVFYEINPQGQCEARPGLYRLFNDVIYLLGYSIAPSCLMLFFGVWTIQNARRLRRTTRKLSSFNRRDHTLMLMLFLQILLITITALPHAVQKFYSSLTVNQPKDEASRTVENISILVVRSISFFNHSCTFYILTLSGRLFREELKKIFQTCLTMIIRQPEHRAMRITRKPTTVTSKLIDTDPSI